MLPKSFSLVGGKWTVKMVKDMTDLGRCDPAVFTIYIKEGLNPLYAEQVFYHELTHAVLFSMGRNDHDEVFVDSFGALLHQFTRSQR
jgi:hypothetical protein